MALFFSHQMGLGGNSAPFGQPYGQSTGQQLGGTGVTGVGTQLQTKSPLPNSLSPFPADLKGAANVANLVRPTSQSIRWGPQGFRY